MRRELVERNPFGEVHTTASLQGNVVLLYQGTQESKQMTPTIELNFVDAPAHSFPMTGKPNLPDQGLTTWFMTQPDWYENPHFEGIAICTDRADGIPVVYDLEDDDYENEAPTYPIEGVLQWILEKQGHDFCRPNYTITFS